MRKRSHALGRSRGLVPLLLMAAAAVAMLLGPAMLAGQEQESEETPFDRKAPITVEVFNNNWSDMAIYAVSSGTRHRLTTVTTGTSQKFTLPRHLNADVREIRLLADPIGGPRAVLSDPLILSPGDEVEWHLQNHLALSGQLIN